MSRPEWMEKVEASGLKTVKPQVSLFGKGASVRASGIKARKRVRKAGGLGNFSNVLPR